MNAITRERYDALTEKRHSKEDTEFSEAMARLRAHKSPLNAEVLQKIQATDLPEISGNLSRKKFFFF